jgi:hypothetical protein
MYDPHFVMTLHLMQMHAEEARRWAGNERMLQQARLERRVRPSWQGRKRLLARAGAWLVTVGHELQLRYQPETSSLKGKGIGRPEAAQP